MDIKEKILFKSKTGSYLYGTNTANSDQDYKGVFLPNKEDLLLNKAPKFYTFSTGGKHERNSKEDIDETYYSLHYFLDLLTSGETNALDLFFAYTNKEAVIYQDPIWIELIKNIDKLITCNINKYLGFCKSQAVKYSIKGEKLIAYNKFKDLLQEHIANNHKDTNGLWIKLKDLSFNWNTELDKFIDYIKNEKLVGKRAIIKNTNLFGEHAYEVEMLNKEKYLLISDILFNYEDTIMTCFHKLNKVIESYGKRAEDAKIHNGADYKALSHAVRVLFQAEELLTTGKVNFPFKDEKLNFIMDIKNGTTNLTFDNIVNFIDNGIKRINENIIPNSKLREKADYNWIKKFILNIYK